jgi:hypothetical protein
MNIELVEIFRKTLAQPGTAQAHETFSLRKIYINPEHVVCMRPDESMHRRLDEGRLPEGLDSRQGFTRLYINRGQAGLDVTVVGSPEIIQKKIEETDKPRKVLKG